jgi:putative PIN family toxin of toxin-antitoxin system
VTIVLDTNVLVAGLLSPFGAPAEVLQLLLAEKLRVCYDARILTEYRDVLGRPTLGLDGESVAAALDFLEQTGDLVIPAPWGPALPDPDDAMFLEVAAAGKADHVVTGNLRRFPSRARRGLSVLTPTAFIDAPDVKAL